MIEKGKNYYNFREWQRAKEVFLQAFAQQPKRPEAQLFLARIQIAEKNLNKALKNLLSLKKRFPKHSGIILYLGFTYEKLGI